MGSVRHPRGCGDGIDPAPVGIKGWDQPDTHRDVGMGSTRQTRGCGDGVGSAPTGMQGCDQSSTHRDNGMGSTQHPQGYGDRILQGCGVGCGSQDLQGPGNRILLGHTQHPQGQRDGMSWGSAQQLQGCGDGIQEGLTHEPQGHGNGINWAPTRTWGHPRGQRQDSTDLWAWDPAGITPAPAGTRGCQPLGFGSSVCEDVGP